VREEGGVGEEWVHRQTIEWYLQQNFCHLLPASIGLLQLQVILCNMNLSS
jgi:hypothetical protein